MIAQILGLILMPVVTRLFTPQDFGLLALFISITSILGTISCLQYDFAIMLPKDDEKALNLLSASLICATIVSLFIGLVLWQLKNVLLPLFNAQMIEDYVWAIPAAIFIIGSTQALTSWNSRAKHFTRISLSRIIQSTICHPSRIIFGLARVTTAWALILTLLASQMIAAMFLGATMARLYLKKIVESVSLSKMISAMKCYQNFPKYNIWSSLIVGASLELPILMFSYSFSSFWVGCFALARNILRIPLSSIGTAIYQPFFQKTAAMNVNNEELKPAVINVFETLLSLIVIPLTAISVLGEDIFSFVFGQQWRIAGIIARMFCFSIIVEFATAPAGSLFDTLGKQKAALFLNLNLFAIRFTGLTIGVFFENFMLAILLFVFGDIAGRIIKFMWIFHQVGIAPATFMKIIFEKLIFSLPILIGLYFAKSFTHADYALFVLFISVLLVHGIFILSKRVPIKHFF